MAGVTTLEPPPIPAHPEPALVQPVGQFGGVQPGIPSSPVQAHFKEITNPPPPPA